MIDENMKEHYFKYLDKLRESGNINMFSSGPYLQEAFDLNRTEAKQIVIEWMETFNERNSE